MWERIKLGDYCEIGRGSSPRPIKNQAYFDNGDIPWIKIADATSSYKYIYETKQYVNDYGASFSRKLPAGSLIVSASGVSLGFAIFLGVEGCVHDGWLYFKEIDPNRINKDLLYYLLNTLTKSFRSISYGAAIQNINTEILRNMTFLLPEVEVQKKITAVLSAYDDLIENNNKRIALLEKAAEEIYREWFVRLRFPGWETAVFHKGIPEGWTHAIVKDFGKVITGKTPSTKIDAYYVGEFPFIKTPDMHNNMFVLETEVTLSQLGLDSQKRQTLPENVICVNCIGALSGSVSITVKTCQTNQQINTVILTNQKHREFLFFTLKGMRETIHLFGNTGSTMTNLSKGKFENLGIIKPEESLLNSFSEKSKPIFESIKTLGLQNINLKKSRDLLLSRLISGKLPVDDLNIQFPPSMIPVKEPPHA